MLRVSKKEREQLQLTLIIALVKGEVNRRWLNVCPNKEGDMATCPLCQGCAYELEFDFGAWAVEFMFAYDYPVWDGEFSLGKIQPRNLDAFFKKKKNLGNESTVEPIGAGGVPS